MKLGVIPENLAERLALWFGIPLPGIAESWLGIMASRAVIAATKQTVLKNGDQNWRCKCAAFRAGFDWSVGRASPTD